MLVLLDRDGVINEDLPESVRSLEALRLINGSAEAIARLNQRGINVAVVTNQSVVGRGQISMAMLDAIHDHLRGLLAQHGAHLDAIYACTDAPDVVSTRRKPAAGMLEEALADFHAEAAQTPMVGDALRDLQAAAVLGCPRYLVQTGKGKETLALGLPDAVQPVHVVANLSAAVDALLGGAKGAC